MAGTVAWLCYAGDVRSVDHKPIAQEGSAAHPEHVRAKSKAGGSTEALVDVHSGHDGASNGDGGVLVAVVDKTSNQQDIKHHGIMEKLKQCFPRSEAHRRVLATTEQPRRRCCRPRGRRVRTTSSRRIQVTKGGWLGAQGIGEAGTGFAEMATALG